jgi:Methyltransferase FkbM domain
MLRDHGSGRFGGSSSIKTETSAGLDSAVKSTNAILRKGSGRSMDLAYVCLDQDNVDHIPRYTIDALLGECALRRPMLIKCDIEGAELLMLKGAERLLRKSRPDLLLSVHRPDMLSAFNCTRKDVEGFVQSLRYTIDVIATDWEEHWMCRASTTDL